MGTMVAAVLASIVVSLIVTRLMTNIFLKELEGIDDTYREKLMKAVIDVIENKKSTQQLLKSEEYEISSVKVSYVSANVR